MLLSAVSLLVVAQPSSEFPEGLMNYPACNLELFYKKTNKSSPVTSTMRVKRNRRCIPSLVYDESTCNHEDYIKSIIILTK
jgi:hypothetical protein